MQNPGRLVVAVLVGGLATARGVAPSAAQPSPTPAQATDYAAARAHYRAGEAALAAGDFAEAGRQYRQALALTGDPVLYYRIGLAAARAGDCEAAAQAFATFVAEAAPRPEDQAAVADARAACVPSPPGASPPPGPALPSEPPTSTAPGPGDAATAPGPGPGRAQVGGWIATAGAIALVTSGVVLALSAEAAETDAADILTLSLDGERPRYDGAVAESYDRALATGRRYERLSWAAFGLAGAATATAVVLLWPRGERAARPINVVPVLGPDTVGVQSMIRF